MSAGDGACTCKESFGQPIWSPLCEVHFRCAVEMRGIPIRCILASGHKGDHK